MPIKAILFDLDGTLLPLEFNDFIPGYFKLLDEKFSNIFAAGILPKLILASTDAMVNNDGSTSNADALWAHFEKLSGRNRHDLLPLFEAFYANDFGTLGEGVGKWDEAKSIVELAKASGRALVMATNPVFPQVAIEHRLKWAGVDPVLFDLITAYENMRFTKPNPGYYLQIASMIDIEPKDCLMIGNDVGLDLEPARIAGMKTFMVKNDYTNLSENGFTADYEGLLEETATLFS